MTRRRDGFHLFPENVMPGQGIEFSVSVQFRNASHQLRNQILVGKL
jgi:hypothetical protein